MTGHDRIEHYIPFVFLLIVTYILWHEDLLLGNDCEISKYTTAVTE
jgi:hypothetical protein